MDRIVYHITLIVTVLILSSAGGMRNAVAQQANTEIIEDIKRAYANLDFPVAEARIAAAFESYDKFSPAELSEIYVVSALIHFFRNDTEGTRRQLELGLQINPKLSLDTRSAPPQVIELFDELAKDNSVTSPPEPEIRYLVVQDPRPAAVMRSMILPGWGQLHKKERKKGLLLISAWGVTSIGSLVAHVKRKQAEDRYLASLNLEEIENRYPSFDRWHKTRNNLFIAAAGVWVYSYIDALIHSTALDSNPDAHPVKLSISPSFHTGRPAPKLTLRYRLQH